MALSFSQAMSRPVYEPNPRKGSLQPRWLLHRFPIKGGLSARETWIRDMSRPNPMLQRLFEKMDEQLPAHLGGKKKAG